MFWFNLTLERCPILYLPLKKDFEIISISLYAPDMNRFKSESTQQSQGAIFLGNSVNTMIPTVRIIIITAQPSGLNVYLMCQL